MFNQRVASAKFMAEAHRRATRMHRALGEEIRRLREDAGIARSGLAAAAGIDLAYLCRIEDGRERPTIDVLVRIATVLGADLSARLYPNTGPIIRDRFQARISEALLGLLNARWRPFPEVVVRQPSRGWIDLVLHAGATGEVVATEIQSDLRRLEQLLRWFPEKVASLPSWEGWAHLGPVVTTSQLLIIRSTKTTRQVGRDFQRQLTAAYPAHPADAIAALAGTAAWPGAALIWAEIERERVRFVERR